ncbi:MAG: nucleotidyl transferase AbiEii/AbiGii toxin family protein [Candidatus Symbiothrix sp.]|jgi:hypothetical protein|nr:nucleotidyl transferase AbiEii/AbiGii toxin family protein [Candidatus Symbiothrix sp.]
MHKEILSQQQIDLLPLIRSFKREYYLVGGTAIALYIGHRRSIDFDLFKHSAINHKKNLDKIANYNVSFTVTRRVAEQMNLTINDVKVTFFEYPFDLAAEMPFEKYIKLPSLLDLAAMKSYALGRRSKWKDYVDLYFLLRDHFSIDEISQRAGEIYGELFSAKLFRAQLAYFEDIDYTEEVEYLVSAPKLGEIKEELIEKATNIL